MNRAAYVAAVMAGFATYHVVRLILRNLDLASWRHAWERVPAERRQAFRDTLLAEDGITSDGR